MARMRLDQPAIDGIVERVLSRADFFAEYWGKRPIHVPGAALDCVGLYGTDDFLHDLASCQPSPYLLIGVRDGERDYSHPTTTEQLRSGVENGAVAPMRISRTWHEPDAPANWDWMRALFGSLCRAASMIYMSPPRSENVDLFLAGPRSHLGVHYDSSHTFTLQLSGERKWVVEESFSLEERLAATRHPEYSVNDDLSFEGATVEFTLRAGDVLYVPAYCIHGVSGVSWSVSLGLGLRAFNEIDFLAHLLETIERTKYLEYPPVESLPESAGERHVQAKMELLKRVRALLKQLEMAAVGKVMAPLNLPATLAPLDPMPSGGSSRLDRVSG
jgi:ribosomal protein L16 Arg81 hydroxylase